MPEELAKDADDEFMLIDGSLVRAHQDAAGGRKRNRVHGSLQRGPTTKINVVCDALTNPIRILVGEGNGHDLRFAPELIAGLSSTTVIADKAYNSAKSTDQPFEQDVDSSSRLEPVAESPA